MLDLDIDDLDAPGFRLFVQQNLDAPVELVPLGQHLIEFVLAENGAQRGLGQLGRGLEEIFHIDDRALRVHHAEIDDRADPDGHIVL